MMQDRAELQSQFLRDAVGACETSPLAGDASFRRYVRIITPEKTYMLMDAPPDKEPVDSFISVSTLLTRAGYSAPRILAQDAAAGFLLLEDLGDDTFSRLLARDLSHEPEYYQAAVSLLADWQSGGIVSGCQSLPHYDSALLLRELQLFSDWFLPQIMDGAALSDAQAEYLEIWQGLLVNIPLATNQFVHRDYHADNLMWLPRREGHARVGLLDYQDAVWGDAAYDLVSLLEDARRDVPSALALRLKAQYVRESAVAADMFHRAYALLAAQRNSKIVGIFTRLAARDGKAHYLNYLPRVWGYLSQDVLHPELLPLARFLSRVVPQDARGVVLIRKDATALGLTA